MTETGHRVPGPNEPDPDNIRLRSFQGGTDGLAAGPTQPVNYNSGNYEGASAGRGAADSPFIQNKGVTHSPQWTTHGVPIRTTEKE